MKKLFLFVFGLIIFVSCKDDYLNDKNLLQEKNCYLKSGTDFIFPSIEIKGGFLGKPCYFTETEMNPTGSKVGGGEGYLEYIDRSQAKFIVSNRDELVQCIMNSNDGDIIFLEQNIYDFSDCSFPSISKQITLASDRSSNKAATIISNNINQGILIEIISSYVRISGLIIKGPHSGIYYDSDFRSIGIRANKVSKVCIDNCEISSFSNAGITCRSATDVWIHHNFIHHCQRDGMGYGVVLSDTATEVLIEANAFSCNRHDIAGSGDSGQKYEARYNVDYQNSEQGSAHSFDMHCRLEYDNDCECQDIGGSTIFIHHNYFLDNSNQAIRIRGNPEVGCWIQNNYFTNSSEGNSNARETFYAICKYPHVNNLFVKDNYYSKKCIIDVFISSESKWLVSEGATSEWKHYNSSVVNIDAMGFGDFNGDGKTDVIRTTGSEWLVSEGATSEWKHYNSSAVNLNAMRFGDFNGDGKTDAIRTTGSEWFVSEGANTEWKLYNTSVVNLSAMRFGDFNGDGKTDVLRTTGSEWLVSEGATSEWKHYNSSVVNIDAMGFGDFNGDGKTDVIRTTGSEWLVSEGATSEWKHYNSSSFRLTELAFGNFKID